MVSLGDEIEYIVEDELIKGKGVCIKSNVAHTGSMDKSGMLMFLFTEPCRYTKSIDEVYLKGKNHCVIDDKTVENMLEVYRKYEEFDKLNGQELVDNILCVCGLNPWDEERYDERIRDIFNIQTIRFLST